MRQTFSGIVNSIEYMLSEYYRFAPVVSASGYMINDAVLSDINSEGKINKADFQADRGSVLFLNEGEESDLFIGLHIADRVVETIEGCNPLQCLNGENLDVFCLLVEEISHFHLLLNRVSDRKNVTRLELEWQAEIDKLLVSSMILKKQSGFTHFNQLVTALFEDAQITNENNDLYKNAARYAAKFWHETIKNSGWSDEKVRNFLMKNYHLDWNNKRTNIENLRSA